MPKIDLPKLRGLGALAAYKTLYSNMPALTRRLIDDQAQNFIMQNKKLYNAMSQFQKVNNIGSYQKPSFKALPMGVKNFLVKGMLFDNLAGAGAFSQAINNPTVMKNPYVLDDIMEDYAINDEFENRYNLFKKDVNNRPIYDDSGRPVVDVENNAFGDASDVYKYASMDTQGKKELLESGWKTRQEREDFARDLANAGLGIKQREDGSWKPQDWNVWTKPSFRSPIALNNQTNFGTYEGALRQSDLKHQHTLDSIFDRHLTRQKDNNQGEINAHKEKYEDTLSDEEVNEKFKEAITPSKDNLGNGVWAAFHDYEAMEKALKNGTSSLTWMGKTFDAGSIAFAKEVVDSLPIEKKREYLAEKAVLEDKIGPAATKEYLENRAKEYINDKEGPVDWIRNLGNDIGLSAVTYTMDKINGLRQFGKSLLGMQGTVFVNKKGEIIDPDKVINLNKSEVYPSYGYYEGKNFIPVTQKTMDATTLDYMGKDSEGRDYKGLLNNKIVSNAEITGTFDEELQDKYKNKFNGNSPYKYVYKTGDDNDLWYETFKMSSFAIADMASMALTEGIGSLGKALSTTGKLGRATGAVLGATAKAMSQVSPTVGAVGISHAYARNQFYEDYAGNLMLLDETARKQAETNFKGRLNSNSAVRKSFNQDVENEYNNLMAEYNEQIDKERKSGAQYSDYDIYKIQESAKQQAQSKVWDKYVENEFNDLKDRPEYTDQTIRAAEDAADGALATAATDGLKYFLVNNFGYRQYLFKNRKQLMSPELNKTMQNIVEKNNKLVYTPTLLKEGNKINWRNALKGTAKSYGKIFWGGAWTNFTDDMQAAGGKKVNAMSFNNFLNGEYDVAANAGASESLGAASAYLVGAMESLAEPHTWQAGLVGGLGSQTSAAINVGGILSQLASKEARQEWKEMTMPEKISVILNNGLLSDLATKVGAERTIEKHVENVNKIVDEYDDFEGLQKALSVNLAKSRVANPTDKEMLDYIEAILAAEQLRRFENDPALYQVSKKSHVVSEAQDLLKKLTEVNSATEDTEFNNEDAAKFVDEYFQQNPEIARTRENEIGALQMVHRNAENLRKAIDEYDKADKELSEIESRRGKKASQLVRSNILTRRALSSFLHDTMDRYEREISGKSYQDRGEEEVPMGVYGNYKSLEEQINANYSTLKKFNKRIESAEQGIEKAQKELDDYLAEHKDEKATEESAEKLEKLNINLNLAKLEHEHAVAVRDKVQLNIYDLEEEASAYEENLKISKIKNDTKPRNIEKELERRKARGEKRAERRRKRRGYSKEIEEAGIEEQRRDIEAARQKKYDDIVENGGIVLTAEEILNLPAEYRAEMLTMNNFGNYSKEQQNQIQKAREILKERDVKSNAEDKNNLSIFDKVEHLADLTKISRANNEAFAKMRDNIEEAEALLDAEATAKASASAEQIGLYYAGHMERALQGFEKKYPGDINTAGDQIYLTLRNHTARGLDFLLETDKDDPNFPLINKYRKEIEKAKEWSLLQDDISRIVRNHEYVNREVEAPNADYIVSRILSNIKDAKSKEEAIQILKDIKEAEGIEQTIKDIYSDVIDDLSGVERSRKATTEETSKQKTEREAKTKKEEEKQKEEIKEIEEKHAPVKEETPSLEEVTEDVPDASKAMPLIEEDTSKVPSELDEGRREEESELIGTKDVNLESPSLEEQVEEYKGKTVAKETKTEKTENIEKENSEKEKVSEEAKEQEATKSTETAEESSTVKEENAEEKTTSKEQAVSAEQQEAKAETIEDKIDKEVAKAEKEDIVIAKIEPDATDEGNKINTVIETADGKTYAILGHAFYEYDADALKDPDGTGNRVQRRRVPDKKGDVLSKYFEWLDSEGIKLQKIIDEELAKILKVNPILHVMYTNPQKNIHNDINVGDIPFIVVKYTDAVKKLHNEDNGGVVTVGEDQYLIVGTLGFPNGTPGKNVRDMRGRHAIQRGGRNFWSDNPNVRFWVSQDQIEVNEFAAGRVPTQLIGDEEKKLRKLSELLADPKRNPSGIKSLERCAWGIVRYSSMARVNVDPKIPLHDPRDIVGNVGGLFLYVVAANGEYVPISIKTPKLSEIADGDLKNIIETNIRNLASPDFNVRLEAKKNLRQFLHLSQDGKDILIGSEKSAVVGVFNGDRQLGDSIVIDSKNPQVDAVLDAVYRLNPFINITVSNLKSKTALQMYDEAGALMTDAAYLGTVNANYTIFDTDEDGKPIKDVAVEKIASYREETDLEKLSNQKNNVEYSGGKIYRKSNDTWYDESGKVVTDNKLIDKLNYQNEIRVDKKAPDYVKKKKNKIGIEYYVFNSDRENPVVVCKYETATEIKVFDKENALKVLDFLEKNKVQDLRNEESQKQLDKLESTDAVTKSVENKIEAEPDMKNATQTGVSEVIDFGFESELEENKEAKKASETLRTQAQELAEKRVIDIIQDSKALNLKTEDFGINSLEALRKAFEEDESKLGFINDMLNYLNTKDPVLRKFDGTKNKINSLGELVVAVLNNKGSLKNLRFSDAFKTKEGSINTDLVTSIMNLWLNEVVPSFYGVENTDITFARVTSVISADVTGSRFNVFTGWGIPSTFVGDGVDEFVRDAVGDNLGNLDTLDKRYPNASLEALQEFSKQIDDFKDYWTITQGFTFVPRDVKASGFFNVRGKDGSLKKIPVAGTLDLLAYDRNGDFYVFDMKTKRGNITDSDIAKWKKQLSAYATMLEEKYGITVKGIKIIPIQVTYPTPLGEKARGSIGTTLYNGDPSTHQLTTITKGEEIPYKGTNPKLMLDKSSGYTLKLDRMAETPVIFEEKLTTAEQKLVYSNEQSKAKEEMNEELPKTTRGTGLRADEQMKFTGESQSEATTFTAEQLFKDSVIGREVRKLMKDKGFKGKTIEEVNKFLQDLNMPITGITDINTWMQILENCR